MNKKVLILNTGGTISSVKKNHGYEPINGYIDEVLNNTSIFHHPELPCFTIYEYQPLLDSSNMTLVEWNQMAKDVANFYYDYDGFIILHGTDTMAYTASALSFMLENLAKPVILTGSQIPLSEVRNDALDNLLTSLWLCANQPINEVCIYFNRQLLRGNRSQKISAQNFEAFDSPNFAKLATVNSQIEIDQNLLLPIPKKAFCLQPIRPYFIANFRLFPGLATEVLEHLLAPPVQGLILETYGAGNAPNNESQLLAILTQANRQGIVIVNCTQCHHGRVEMNQYATGYTLSQAGVISGFDMTPEAAHCKLLYLLNKNYSIDKVKELMQTSLVGELTQ